MDQQLLLEQPDEPKTKGDVKPIKICS
jgi:hypothetical protein